MGGTLICLLYIPYDSWYNYLTLYKKDAVFRYLRKQNVTGSAKTLYACIFYTPSQKQL